MKTRGAVYKSGAAEATPVGASAGNFQQIGVLERGVPGDDAAESRFIGKVVKPRWFDGSGGFRGNLKFF